VFKLRSLNPTQQLNQFSGPNVVLNKKLKPYQIIVPYIKHDDLALNFSFVESDTYVHWRREKELYIKTTSPSAISHICSLKRIAPINAISHICALKRIVIVFELAGTWKIFGSWKIFGELNLIARWRGSGAVWGKEAYVVQQNTEYKLVVSNVHI
jgi:hypothetical protein